MTLYPSILTDSLSVVRQQVQLVHGLVDCVQIDVVDGEFADTMTLFPSDLHDLDFGSLKLDVHLMTVDPINDVVECEGLPISCIFGQVERMSSQQAFIDHVKSFGWGVGLSLDLYTPVSAIDERSFLRIDAVQIMAVQAGMQGQLFHKETLQKIAELVALRAQRGKHWQIIVDGGINRKTIRECINSAVDGFVVGSDLWEHATTAEQVKHILSEFDRLLHEKQS